MKRLALAAALAFAAQAQAYCIYNQLPDRTVAIEQEPHPDKMRDARRLRAMLHPGESRCCRFHQLDCNPLGRDSSIVSLEIRIVGEPIYECGFPPGTEPSVKVTGGGTVRIVPNPRQRSASPYILRIRTHDGKDLTGPRGLACPESKTKGKP